MAWYSIESRTREYVKYVKGYGFLSFARNLSNKYRKQLLDTGTNPSKKVIHETAEAIGEFLGNKITDDVAKLYNDKIVKGKLVTDDNSRNVEKVINPPEKRKKILSEL